MKKLMITAAVVCVAAYAQAVCAISWKNNTGIAFVDATGELMPDIGDLVLVNLGQTINWDNATAIDRVDSATAGATTLKINSSGVVSGQVKFNWTDGSDANLIDNGDYLALMYKDEKGDLQKLSYYNNGDPVEVGNEAVYKVNGITNNSYSKTGAIVGLTGDYMQAVPEPTSGLLLLLGVAGLALRRRRA